MELRSKLILATLLLVAATSFAGTWMMGPGKGSQAAASGLGVFEGFEGTGVPTQPTWSDISTGGNTVNWDYTTAPIVGSQSLFIQDPTSNARTALYDFTGQADEIWVALRYRASADPATNAGILNIIDTGTNALGIVRTQTNGTIVILVTATQSATIIDVTPGTNYRIKVRWKKASGLGNDEELQIWAAAESAGAWGATVSQTNGASTNQADAVYFQTVSTFNMDQVIDNVLVKTSDITWSELD